MPEGIHPACWDGPSTSTTADRLQAQSSGDVPDGYPSCLLGWTRQPSPLTLLSKAYLTEQVGDVPDGYPSPLWGWTRQPSPFNLPSRA